MTYDEIHPVFRVALGVHEAFRRMGFPSEKLFAHRNPDGTFFYALIEGKRRFVFTCGELDMTEEKCTESWEKTVNAFMTKTSQEDADRIWQEFAANCNLTEFALRVHAKGFKVFGLTNPNLS